MTLEQISKLIDGMYTKYPRVDGWVFNYDYPGFFNFTKDGISFRFTPDWDIEGELCIQVFQGDSEKYVDGWDIAYSGILGPDDMMSLIREKLKQCEQWTL